MLVISSRISGWRVTDSITLPKMYPTPIPGPMVPRPAPTPSAIAFPASVPYAFGSAACATDTIEVRDPRSTGPPSFVVCRSKSRSSVRLRHRAADVDGGQRREDERLQGCDQDDLEQEEEDRRRERNGADPGEAEQDDQPTAHEQDQKMAGEDVCEQSHG